MARAPRARMNQLFFSLKRGFHKTVHHIWNLFPARGMTPARYDMLTAVERAGGCIRQSDLRLVLGVSPFATSRMVRILEKLGWVERGVDSRDRREILVRLTDAGEWEHGQQTSLLFVDSFDFTLGIDATRADGAGHPSWEPTELLVKALHRLRRAYADFGSLDYGWWDDW